MNDITATLLTILLVLYSLVALLSVELHQDSTNLRLVNNEERISELGLRDVFHLYRSR